MGITKTEHYTLQQNELAHLARVLGHPARLAIVQYLLKVDSCVGVQIVDEIPLAQPTISRHLKELKAAGIIQGTIEGTSVNYCINGPRWREVQALFNTLFDTYVPDLDCDY